MHLSKTRLALAAALVSAALAPALAQAEGGLSFNIGAVSLYKFNGIDQDNRAPKNFIPAVQGGVDYDFGNGLYVGNWNSTGKFGDARVEIDLYAGYKGELGNGLSYDVGFASYLYPNSGGGWNGNEFYGSVGYGIFTARYTHGVSGWSDKRARLSLGLAQPLTDALTLTAGVAVRNNKNYDGAYDYNLGVSYDLGNDLSTTAAVSGAQTSKVGDVGKARLVVGIKKSF